MAQLAAGDYYIVNSVGSQAAFGQQLALNFNGDDKVVTVTPWNQVGQDPSQVWTVGDFDGNTQTVSPRGATDLQIGMGPGVLKIYPASNLVWTIRQTEQNPYVWTVQDGDLTVFWGLHDVTADEPVYFDAGTGSELQNWLFVSA